MSSVCREGCPTLTVPCSQRELQAQLHLSLNFKLCLNHSITLFSYICTVVSSHSSTFTLLNVYLLSVSLLLPTYEIKELKQKATTDGARPYTHSLKRYETKENRLQGLADALSSFSTVWSLIMPTPLMVVAQWLQEDLLESVLTATAVCACVSVRVCI